MDTHILPRDIYDYVEGPSAARKPVYEFDAKGKLVKWSFPGWHTVEGTTPLWPPGSGAGYPGMTDIDARLEDYRKLGIEKQLLLPQYTAVLFNYTLDPELAVAMAHSYNVSILNLTKQYPAQFIGAALVALQDVPSAISEMEWAHRNGFAAVAVDKVFPVRQHAFSEALGSHRELWPFFRRAEQLGMPVVLHNVQHGHRISNIMIFQQDGLDIGVARGRSPESHVAVHERAVRRFSRAEGDIHRGRNIVHQAAGRALRCGTRKSAAQLRGRRRERALPSPRRP